MRPALGARYRLRVKSSISLDLRIPRRSNSSIGQRAIVVLGRSYGKLRIDGVARPAVRAIDIWIQMAAVARIQEFRKAIIANRQVRRHANRKFQLAFARPNR